MEDRSWDSQAHLNKDRDLVKQVMGLSYGHSTRPWINRTSRSCSEDNANETRTNRIGHSRRTTQTKQEQTGPDIAGGQRKRNKEQEQEQEQDKETGSNIAGRQRKQNKDKPDRTQPEYRSTNSVVRNFAIYLTKNRYGYGGQGYSTAF